MNMRALLIGVIALTGFAIGCDRTSSQQPPATTQPVGQTKEDAVDVVELIGKVNTESVVLGLLNAGQLEGKTLESVRKSFWNVRHQFTVMREGAVKVCVSCPVEHEYVEYYLVFSDGVFEKMIEVPEINWINTTRRDGRTVQIQEPVNAEAKTLVVLNAPGLSTDGFKATLQAKLALFKQAKGMEDPGMLGPLASSAAMNVLGGRAKKDLDKNRELEKVYDPFKVALSMNATGLEQQIGHPAREIGAGPVIRVYGTDVKLNFAAGLRVSWVDVRFDGDAVSAVYSHDFFDERLLGR